MRTPPRPISTRSPAHGGPRDVGVERVAGEPPRTKASPALVWTRSARAIGAAALFAAATFYGCGLPVGGLRDDSTFPPDADPSGEGTDAADPSDAPGVAPDGGALDDGPGDVTVPPDPAHEGGHEDHVDTKPPPDAEVDHNSGGVGPEAGADSGADAPPDAPLPPPPTPPTFIQPAMATPPGAPPTITAAFAKPQTAGNMNVLAIGWADATAQVVSVSDKAGNLYTLAVGPTLANNPAIAFTQSMYYAPIIAAFPAGNTVTVTFDVGASAPDLRVAEYQGLDSDAPVDVTAGMAGTGMATTAGPVMTHGPALLVAANMVPLHTTAPGAGFTQRILTMPDSDILEDRYAATAGSYSASAAVDNGVNWVMQLVAFRAK